MQVLEKLMATEIQQIKHNWKQMECFIVTKSKKNKTSFKKSFTAIT